MTEYLVHKLLLITKMKMLSELTKRKLQLVSSGYSKARRQNLKTSARLNNLTSQLRVTHHSISSLQFGVLAPNPFMYSSW